MAGIRARGRAVAKLLGYYRHLQTEGGGPVWGLQGPDHWEAHCSRDFSWPQLNIFLRNYNFAQVYGVNKIFKSTFATGLFL